ncbi:MAG: amidohydrolase family protein [Phycisphaerales bacterium]
MFRYSTIGGHRPAGLLAACLCILLLAGSAAGQIIPGLGPKPLVIENVRVLNPDGSVTENAILIVQRGAIERIGVNLEIPDRANRVDGGDGFVTPGFIDVHSALGLTASTGGGGPTHRAFDAFNRYALDDLRDAVRHGVTAAYLPARGGGGVNGVGCVVRFAPAPTGSAAGEALIEESALCINLASADSSTRRLQTLADVRQRFKSALEYRESLEVYEEDLEEYEEKIAERAKAEGDSESDGDEDEKDSADDDEEPNPEEESGSKEGDAKKDEDEIKKPARPRTDRNAEMMLKAIDGELPVRIEADRSADILNALALADEFNLTVVLEGGAEAHLVANEIADAEVRVVLDPERGFGPPAWRTPLADRLASLDDAGVDWRIGAGATDPGRSRFVLLAAQEAAGAVGTNANDRPDPLRMVTVDAAELLGVSDRVGRLERGRAADFVIWSAHPLEADARVQRVYIDGKLVYLDRGASSE